MVRCCAEFARRGAARLEEDPTLPDFDLFIVHADADVAAASYDQVSPELAALASRALWPPLPCSLPCPPAEADADAVRARLLAWAGLTAPGPRTALCVPSKAIEAWLAAAVLGEGHPLLVGVECRTTLAAQLAILPRALRVPKSSRAYRERAGQVTAAWELVRRRCTQAERFSREIEAILPRLP